MGNRFEGTDILTGKKYTHPCPAHATVDVPLVAKREYLLLDLDEEKGFLSLWDGVKGTTKEDLRVAGARGEGGKGGEGDGEVLRRLRMLWRDGVGGEVWVSVLGAMGKEVVDGVREGEGERE